MQNISRLPRETARDYAMRVIRENIISLELEPGSMVSENELASALGISRTPVREALIDLSKTQIIEILPQKGCRVALIDYNMVEEARFLRLVLETAIMERICSIREVEVFSKLVENVQLQQFYFKNNVLEKLMGLDDEFHEELFRISNMMQTYHLISTMSVHFDRIRRMSVNSVKDLKIVADHTNILNAILDHNEALAKQYVAEHLSRYIINKRFICEKYAQYFLGADEQ